MKNKWLTVDKNGYWGRVTALSNKIYMCRSLAANIMLCFHVMVAGNSKRCKACFFSALLHHCVSILLSLCLSCDPSIISIAPQCAVLFRLIASPPSSLPAFPPSLLPSLSLSLCFHSITLHALPSPPALITLPFLDYPFLPLSPLPSLPCLSSCHHASSVLICHILRLAGFL